MVINFLISFMLVYWGFYHNVKFIGEIAGSHTSNSEGTLSD